MGNDPSDGGEKTFTQEDLNKFLAEDRRKHQARYDQLETSYKSLMQNQNLTKEERDRLNEELEGLQKLHRTKEQQIEMERRKQQEEFNTRVKKLEEESVQWKDRYMNSTIDRALQDAAVAGEAFNAEQIVTILRPLTKMVEEKDDEGNLTGAYVPYIDFPDVDEKTQERTITRRTPNEAVQRMQELTDKYGNLFKAHVNGGLGGFNSSDGGSRVDVRNLTPEQYQELRRTNPKALYG